MSVTAVRCRRVRAGNKARGDFLWELKSTVRTNRAMFLLAAVFLAGMICGAIYSRSADLRTLSRLDFLFAGNFKARAAQPLLSIFSASFASAFLFVLACFLCGLSMWGAFIIPAIPFFRGFGLGLTSGFLYVTYGWKGFLYNFAVILPGAFFCCLAILASSLEGIRYSRSLVAHGTTAGEIPIRNYLLRFGAILAWACMAAVLDTLMSALFGGCFSF
jgi:stage II sporulation protein M